MRASVIFDFKRKQSVPFSHSPCPLVDAKPIRGDQESVSRNDVILMRQSGKRDVGKMKGEARRPEWDIHYSPETREGDLH